MALRRVGSDVIFCTVEFASLQNGLFGAENPMLEKKFAKICKLLRELLQIFCDKLTRRHLTRLPDSFLGPNTKTKSL
ncbi:hypothetical protein [Ruegeria sp. HKCCD6157]|uniref:hypothetical protein n=1 Tax=Ruegeria sp. HKCCD6157 TaxID=2690707 RepID=UPI0014930CCC|nr:hypothetical protein [Ruegeria sp. HKCCD6157]NOE26542.1 hypothetical protein [Ruegeria sp. HKCCD6157]